MPSQAEALIFDFDFAFAFALATFKSGEGFSGLRGPWVILGRALAVLRFDPQLALPLG